MVWARRGPAGRYLGRHGRCRNSKPPGLVPGGSSEQSADQPIYRQVAKPWDVKFGTAQSGPGLFDVDAGRRRPTVPVRHGARNTDAGGEDGGPRCTRMEQKGRQESGRRSSKPRSISTGPVGKYLDIELQDLLMEAGHRGLLAGFPMVPRVGDGCSTASKRGQLRPTPLGPRDVPPSVTNPLLATWFSRRRWSARHCHFSLFARHPYHTYTPDSMERTRGRNSERQQTQPLPLQRSPAPACMDGIGLSPNTCRGVLSR